MIPASCSPLSDREAMMLAGEDWREPGNDLLPCRLCNAQYKCSGSLKRHIRQSHMNQPVFRCELCQAGFMYKDHYVGHMNKHNNTPTFRCTKCPKMFIYKGDMYKHRKQCQGAEDEAADTLDTGKGSADSN